jgi:superfamily II DNA or RNA helicase
MRVGVVPGLIKAGQAGDPTRYVQIASVQTLARRKTAMSPDLIIVDEAHHAVAKSYMGLFERCPSSAVLGVTATPWRAGKGGFGPFFRKLLLGPSTPELIADGYLVRPRVFNRPLGDALDSVGVRAGDYDESQLASVMDNARIHGDLVASYERYGGGRQMIVFAVNVEHSMHIRDRYIQAGYEAVHLDGTSPDSERQFEVERFRSGKTRILCNCNLFTEGFDVPDVGVVQLVRPTKSLALYIQSVGRAMRASEGKQDCIILDHADNVVEHGLPHELREWTLSGGSGQRMRKRPGADLIAVSQDGSRTEVSLGDKLVVNEMVELVEVPDDHISVSLKAAIEHSRRRPKLQFADARAKLIAIRDELVGKMSPEARADTGLVQRERVRAIRIWESQIGLENFTEEISRVTETVMGYPKGYAKQHFRAIQEELYRRSRALGAAPVASSS